MGLKRLGFFLGGLALAGLTMHRLTREKFSFAGQTALITGGSRGLGLLIARRLAAEGVRVALLARDPNELRRAQQEIQREGGDAITVECDLLDRQQLDEAVVEVIRQLGGIDILVNNAGLIEVGPLAHMKREDFERSIDLHLWAPFNLMWQVVPHMRKRGGGRIVNISSIGGRMAVPHLAPYSVGKFALAGLSDAMRNELARANIAVTTVTPGLMRTGSHVNARFKGDHASEYAWFSLAASLPVGSIEGERAAEKIVEACRRGQSVLVMPLPARIGIAGQALFPNLTGAILKWVNWLLPAPTNDAAGDELKSGWESRQMRSPIGWLRFLTDAMAGRNNES